MFPTGDHGRRLARRRVGSDAGLSGPIGRERVHYEAPPAARLAAEMKAFLDWFNGEAAIDPVLKAAVAHLWFVTVHPLKLARRVDRQRGRGHHAPRRKDAENPPAGADAFQNQI